ncbi:FAD-dependent monooxygenase [Streptomyces sp. DSM 44917]|uniref:FAD-dependent monooxygenase n=1 Tax=Streptomyces boetiae TaxID=3075541 RepID=A0ABU2L720_9ACTN|nr:FAD-dependent monooxygenase [Streptomyces sp. DSM 44917]MDT0307366.1 FAD-dependent monooxygenase [Streptomyces sp. DSM 44917]
MTTEHSADGHAVLIAGAGPTGLTAACTLLQQGVPVRVVDRRSGPATAPKAIVLWSGALEVLDRLEVAGPLTERALALAGASYWSRGRRLAAVRFGGLPNTRFPGPVCAPQPVTEELLYQRLLQLGGDVAWNTEVREVASGADGVTVALAPRDGGEITAERADWLIAADGMHSTVRGTLGDVAFEGATYGRDFLLGDVVLDAAGGSALPEREAQYHLTPDGVLVVVQLPGGGHRVFFDQAAGTRTDTPDLAELQGLLDARGPGQWRIRDLWWSSRFQVHTKVASAFRSGRVFLAGDAAHVHSPAGGQGLNTGVQDGYDIGWKLAAVVRGADAALLDSYQAERRPTAVRAVANADRQTKLWLVRNPLVRRLRDLLLGRLSRSGALERRLIPELAQIDLDLSASPAVVDAMDSAPGADAAARPGRRLTDAVIDAVHGTKAATLHGYVASGRHTVLVFDDGSAGDGPARAAEEARARLDRALADVLLVRAHRLGRPAPAAPGYDVAELAASENARPAQAVYVRPDGMTGARVPVDGSAGIGAFLAGVPAAHAPSRDLPGTR